MQVLKVAYNINMTITATCNQATNICYDFDDKQMLHQKVGISTLEKFLSYLTSPIISCICDCYSSQLNDQFRQTHRVQQTQNLERTQGSRQCFT